MVKTIIKTLTNGQSTPTGMVVTDIVCIAAPATGTYLPATHPRDVDTTVGDTGPHAFELEAKNDHIDNILDDEFMKMKDVACTGGTIRCVGMING